MGELRKNIRHLLMRTLRKQEGQRTGAEISEDLQKKLEAIIQRFQEIRDSYYSLPSDMVRDLLGPYELLQEVCDELEEILKNPHLKLTEDERKRLDEVHGLLLITLTPYYSLYESYYLDEADEVYSLRSLKEWEIDETCERIKEVISILSTLRGKGTEKGSGGEELRKEIRRLLWDSFVSARLKTLKKQEIRSSEDEEKE